MRSAHRLSYSVSVRVRDGAVVSKLAIPRKTCDTEENLLGGLVQLTARASTWVDGPTLIGGSTSLDFTTWPGMNRLVIPAIERAWSDSAESQWLVIFCAAAVLGC